jgi:hypothetical protein
MCRERGLVYSEEDTRRRVEARLAARGYRPRKCSVGSVHTFALVPMLGWHWQLMPDLHELGDVTHFDFTRFDQRVYADCDLAGPHGMAARRRQNDAWFAALEETHRKKPVDWVFMYASGTHVLADTVRRVQEWLGIPVVGMCLDDKQSWEGPWLGEQRGLQVDLAGVLDLAWTSAHVATGWYLAEGGRPLYLPSGCLVAKEAATVRKDTLITFIGAKYGFRSSVVRYLARHGVEVDARGRGWPAGTMDDEHVPACVARSTIVLGMGGIGAAEDLTNVKGRDFELVAYGSAAYLTTYSADLARHFHIGREILCYRSRDELLELVLFCASHPQEAAAIAKAGRQRCLSEHRWVHRYRKVLEVVGVLAAPSDAGREATEQWPR